MPWKNLKRDCKQSDGKKGNHVVVKIKSDGETEQESCHTSKEKASSAIRARYASEKNEGKIMKITRRQLRQIIKEELRSRKVISEVSLSQLPEESQEDIVGDVYSHILDLIQNAWPKADIVPGMSMADSDLSRGGRNQFTITYELMSIGTGTGLAGLKSVERRWKNKVAGTAGYKSEFIDNTGNKAFKMRLAKDPIRWSTKKKDGYVLLTVLITLNDDFVAEHEPIVDV